MKAQANEYGVTWARSKSGKLEIAVSADHGMPLPHKVEVWGLWTGTHDLAPVARSFKGPDRVKEARDYANRLWASR